jgi:hypothetical protein
METSLLALPIELRLNIWEHLLAPKVEETAWLGRKTALTTISRSCSAFYPPQPYTTTAARPHDWDDCECRCHGRPFYRLDSRERLDPTILRVSRQIYREALPCLYQRRTFITDPNRTFSSLHDRMSDAWFLLDRFLASIPLEARMSVHSVRIPMLLNQFEVYGCREAFYGIASRLPALKTLYLEVSPSVVREAWTDGNGTPTNVGLHALGHPALDGSEFKEDWEYWLGPVMAFSDAIINIIAVDRYDIGPTMFDRAKVAIETRVWKQLLPMRLKRDRRRIARIRMKLDVSGEDLALGALPE